MGKFAAAKTAIESPVKSASRVPDALTREGGAGYSRDAKSELFLLAVTNMVAEKAFYEDAATRDGRFEALVRQVSAEDPGWIARFVPYLRTAMGMRSASLVMAAEYLRSGAPHARAVVSSALQRADEPAEMLGYWIGHYGRRLPQPLKRGVADAAARLYTEFASMKHDGSKGIRMGDVIELAHPKPRAEWQGLLFEHLLAKRHGRDRMDLSGLPALAARAGLEAVPADARRARVAEGLPDGTTWEWASSWVGGALDGSFWDALIPQMGIFALVRNLRNFDDAGISGASLAAVRARIADPEAVRASRMLPLRFYAAHREVATTRWSEALDAALELSLASVPALPGRTLVLVDVSGSMSDPLSARSRLTRAEAAAVFGAAVAVRAEKADLVAFRERSWDLPFRKAGSVLRLATEIAGSVGGGTETFQALAAHLTPEHSRVVVLTDEQAYPFHGDPAAAAGGRPVYTFNLAGYSKGHLPSGLGNRHAFGGLTDAAFTMLPLLERGRDADWPF